MKFRVIALRFRYSTDWLREKHHSACSQISCRLRRYLFMLRILAQKNAVVSLSAIPVRIISRQRISQSLPRPRSAWSVKLQKKNRRSRWSVVYPSFIISPACSIFNKSDKISILLNHHDIDIAMFIQSWLNDVILHDAVAVDDYRIVRKDHKNGTGWGEIICYTKVKSLLKITDYYAVPSLNMSRTEFLPIIFKNLSLLVIGVYYLFGMSVKTMN